MDTNCRADEFGLHGSQVSTRILFYQQEDTDYTDSTVRKFRIIQMNL